MPIDYCIDHSRRLVVARGRGTFSRSDVLGYQREAWSRPELAGYDELVDMTDVVAIEIAAPAGARVRALAAEAAAMDHPASASKFAIVAPDRLAFGLGRMYQTYREHQPGSRKQVGVFTSVGEAWSFLGTDASEEQGVPSGESGPTTGAGQAQERQQPDADGVAGSVPR
jgi:hypothetical protein